MERETARPVTVGPWQVLADVAATRRAYALRGTETCRCAYCRNFDAARAHLYPAAFVAQLQDLGIDPTREIEVYEMGRMPSGRRLYGGWFYLIGQLSPSEQLSQTVPATPHELASGFSISIREVGNHPVAPFEGAPLLQLEFVAEVRWVFDEVEPQ